MDCVLAWPVALPLLLLGSLTPAGVGGYCWSRNNKGKEMEEGK
jgi:hypothetical protein